MREEPSDIARPQGSRNVGRAPRLDGRRARWVSVSKVTRKSNSTARKSARLRLSELTTHTAKQTQRRGRREPNLCATPWGAIRRSAGGCRAVSGGSADRSEPFGDRDRGVPAVSLTPPCARVSGEVQRRIETMGRRRAGQQRFGFVNHRLRRPVIERRRLIVSSRAASSQSGRAVLREVSGEMGSHRDHLVGDATHDGLG